MKDYAAIGREEVRCAPTKANVISGSIIKVLPIEDSYRRCGVRAIDSPVAHNNRTNFLLCQEGKIKVQDMSRPYGYDIFFVNENDAMNVIWHNHERVRGHNWEMDRDFGPTFLDDLPQWINLHHLINHFPK